MSHDEDVRLLLDHFRGCGEAMLIHDAALDRILARYDALMEEHEWAVAMLLPNPQHVRRVFKRKWRAAHDKVEVALHDE